MKVFVATITDFAWNREWRDAFIELAERDRRRVHQLSADAGDADVILFIDLHQQPEDRQLLGLQNHPLVKEFPDKILVYDERDDPYHTWPLWPGVYTSMPRDNFDPKRQKACAYAILKNQQMQIAADELDAEADLLFSFQGANSHPCRQKILQLSHPRALIENPQLNFFDTSPLAETLEYQRAVAAQKANYRATVARSKFVLCPRGVGTSSFRLYETLASGRVPVIISDQWVAPPGPDWNASSLRMAEKDSARIPQILESRETDFASMAQCARATYREWFAPEVTFHQLIESCAQLLEQGRPTRRKLAFERAHWKNAGAHYQLRTLWWLRTQARKIKPKR